MRPFQGGLPEIERIHTFGSISFLCIVQVVQHFEKHGTLEAIILSRLWTTLKVFNCRNENKSKT